MLSNLRLHHLLHDFFHIEPLVLYDWKSQFFARRITLRTFCFSLVPVATRMKPNVKDDPDHSLNHYCTVWRKFALTSRCPPRCIAFVLELAPQVLR